MPSFDPFSRANSFRSMNRSGVPPASCEAGVAQPDGPIDGADPDSICCTFVEVSISFTVSIRFDLRPSMWSTDPPLVPHDAFGVGYGAGILCMTTSFRFEIPGGPPLDRFGARARISVICSGVLGHA